MTGISLVRDNEGQSKGFAFLEVSNQADADRMITEMHQFYTDAQRRLTVRMVSDETISTDTYSRYLAIPQCMTLNSSIKSFNTSIDEYFLAF